MAKANPVRLQSELMAAATTTGQRHHRSAAEQIEYWASLGQRVSHALDPDKLLAINAGLASVSITPVIATPIDPDQVFASLENDRKLGVLAGSVANSPTRYQASAAHPGLLEQINSDGRRIVGQFKNGHFTPATL